MMNEQILTIVIAVIGAIGGGLVTGLFSRRKTSAEAEATIAATATKAAKELIAEYKAQADRIEAENSRLLTQVSELRQAARDNQKSIDILENTLENLNAQVLKFRLVIAILSMQLRSIGYQPLINPDNIDGMSVDDLNDIASTLNSINARRSEAQASNE